jgi:hypothetical protein
VPRAEAGRVEDPADQSHDHDASTRRGGNCHASWVTHASSLPHPRLMLADVGQLHRYRYAKPSFNSSHDLNVASYRHEPEVAARSRPSRTIPRPLRGPRGPAAARTAWSSPGPGPPRAGPRPGPHRGPPPDQDRGYPVPGRRAGQPVSRGSQPALSCRPPSGPARGWGSPVSTDRAVAISASVARTYVDVTLTLSSLPSVWPA